MILASLARYYRRLATQTDRVTGEPKVPPYGFTAEKISWVVVLDIDGNLVDVISHLTDDKKPKPKLLSVPRPEKRTSGVKPNYLWDKTAYVFGVESNKDKATAKDLQFVASEKTFEAFKQLHLELFNETTDEGLCAVRRFLEQWKPERFGESPLRMEMLDANIVFKLDGSSGYIHEREAARDIWESLLRAEDAEQGLCLVSGKRASIARLHPAIKGVLGGQSSGGSIISFNKDSFTSYCKEQGANAPVSEEAAFAYTTALNYLLRNKHHCVTIGDTSTVFWAEAPDPMQAETAEDFFSAMVTPPDDDQECQKVFHVLEQVRKGRPLQQVDANLASDTRFYVLGLAPNASRISIRFWLDTTFGRLADNFAQHWWDLALEPQAWKTPPSIWRLLIETAPLGKSENISPVLAGELARAVITGNPYPMSVLSQVISRIRTDGDGNGLRIALIKAVLQRRYRKGFIKEEIPMSLDTESRNQAYLLGRLFAVLERIQGQALGEVNAGIADRYYGSASAVPFSVFPRLLAGAKHHLSRLRKDRPGMAVNLDKDLGVIIGALPEMFPRHLSIEEQGRFAIGYYHQKQSFFVKKDSVDSTEE